jgi:hypothetical protein
VKNQRQKEEGEKVKARGKKSREMSSPHPKAGNVGGFIR